MSVIINISLLYCLLQVAKEIWVCENQTVTKWQGTIQSYKEHLRKRILKDLEKPV